MVGAVTTVRMKGGARLTGNLRVGGTTLVSLAFYTTTLPNGVTQSLYALPIVARNGFPPFTYTLTSGTVPAGLSLSSIGILSGTPTTAGTSNFTVTATDALGRSVSQALTLAITTPPTLTLSPASLSGGTRGSPYTATLGTTGGTAPYTYTLSSGTLPSGVTLSSGGVLSGTPTAVGATSCVIRSTDVHGNTSTISYTITIAASAVSISPSTILAPSYNTAYNQPLSATGGFSAYTYALTSGTLPTGITLSSSGVLSGTATIAGTFNITVSATDTYGNTGSQAYTTTITAPTITLSPTSLSNGTQNSAYNATIAASGGRTSYTYAMTAGTIPSGISLASNGILSGTPSSIGISNFTVTATDASGYTGNRAYSLTIVTPVTVTLSPSTGALTAGTAYAAYSGSITASGGTSYTYAVTTGALPTGLTLNATTGAISGTPTTTGTSTFSITATDVSSASASGSYTITINAPTISLAPTSLPSGSQNSAYSQTVSGSGGVSPYTFALTSGSLPTGVTLNTSSGVVSGTPTNYGTSNFTITTTDAHGFTGNRAYTVTISQTAFDYTISANQTNLNLYTYATSPSGGTGYTYTFTINSGVIVGSTSTASAALSTGNWPAGANVVLVNNGYIEGKEGAGGASGTGSAGGPAISTSYNLTVNNTSGYIFGGGGGGGKGGQGATGATGAAGTSQSFNNGCGLTTAAGGAGGTGGAGGAGGTGGNGQGYGNQSSGSAGSGGSVGSGGSGGGIGQKNILYTIYWDPSSYSVLCESGPGCYTSNYSQACGMGVTAYAYAGGTGSQYLNGGNGATGGTGGTGYTGGTGGAWGAAGATGTNGYAGGAAGNAITKNGYTITWLGGNNATQVKGLVQ